MKLAIFSDLHLGIKQNDESWQKIALEWCDEFKKSMIDRGVKDIAFLGDFFHSRNTISVDTLYTAGVFLDKLKDFNIHMIYGNHDLYYLSNSLVSAVSLFSSHPNITVYKEPKVVKLGSKTCCFCGWGYDPLKYEADVLFTHAEINAFKLGEKQAPCEKGILCSDLLRRYKLIYSGHFHMRQDKVYATGKIKYVGNPFHMDYSDEGLPKGYDVFDIETGEIEFVENKLSPRFLRMKLSEMTEVYDINQLKSNIKNTFFKLLIDMNIKLEDLSELMVLISSAEPRTCISEWENGQNFSQDLSSSTVEAINMEDCIRQFVDLLDIPNKEDVVEYVLNLFNRASA